MKWLPDPKTFSPRWQNDQPGQPLAEPKPLFRKLDPAIVEEEEARLGQ